MKAVDDLKTAKIYTQQDLNGSERFLFAGGEVVVFTHSAPDKVTGNEDAAALIPLGNETGVLIVADGVGGLPSAHQASHVAVHTLLTKLDRLTDEQSLRDLILNGIEAANQAVLALGSGGATTMAVIEIQGLSIRPYHVGDSVILLMGQRGKIKLQTIPHSPTGYAVESGLMDEGDAFHHEERSVVSNVVGANDMRIEIGPSVRLSPRDTLVLASDGLADNLFVDEIVQMTRVGSLPKVAEILVGTSHSRMREKPPGRPSHPDDLTFIVFRPTPNGVAPRSRR